MHRGFWGMWGALVFLGMTLAPTAQAQEAERFAVSLHARTTRASARAEQAAWLSLTLPLDRLAAPRALTARPAVAEAPAPAPTPTSPDSTRSIPEPATASAPPVEPSFTFEQLRALSDFSRRATAVALAVAGAATERRRLDSLSSRSRASALLPELRLRAQRNTDQALRWAPTSDDPYRVTQADGAGTTLEASATFHLERLLFSREELVVERLRLQAGTERLKLEQRVLGAVLGLWRARERACAADADDAARLEQGLHAAEHFTELDVLTAGWFSQRAPDFGRAVWGFPEAALGSCQPPDSAPTPPPTKSVASPHDSE